MGRYSDCTYFDALYDAVSELFPVVSRPEACTILRETILAPDDYEVEFNNSSYSQYQLLNMIGHTLINSCVDETPEKTFNDIMESAAEIMKHMNDGYITTDDYRERQDFLELIARDEFVLFAALAFLRTAPEDDTKIYDELILNIIRLREINDLILNFTRDAVEIEVGRAEFEQAKPIYRMLKSLQSLGYDYNFSPKERAGLGIDHEEDADLSLDFNYDNWLKRLMLLQLRKEVDMNISETAPRHQLAAATPVATEPASAEQTLEDHIAALRGTRDQRRFDKNRFLHLEESRHTAAPASDADNN